MAFSVGSVLERKRSALSYRGNPDGPEVYDYMASYSPYDNVTARSYPPMLITGGLNDPRVSYWEPAKWAQKLRDVKTDHNEILVKMEMGAGHMGPSGRYDTWRDEAFVFAFIFRTLKMNVRFDKQSSKEATHATGRFRGPTS